MVNILTELCGPHHCLDLGGFRHSTNTLCPGAAPPIPTQLGSHLSLSVLDISVWLFVTGSFDQAFGRSPIFGCWEYSCTGLMWTCVVAQVHNSSGINRSPANCFPSQLLLGHFPQRQLPSLHPHRQCVGACVVLMFTVCDLSTHMVLCPVLPLNT